MGMATYVLIHGAASDSWYWHPVVPELQARGHDVVAVDLPCDDDAAGFDEYTDAVVESIGDRSDLVVVAQSLGGFTAPLVCERVPVRLLVLLAAMIPAPNESGGDWWTNTGWDEAHRAQAERDGRSLDGEFDVVEEFLHDLSGDVTAQVLARGERAQSGTPMEKPWPLDRWPDVPTRVLLCRDDRFFPAPFMRRVAQERLGIIPDEMPGGHLPALGHPRELVERLESYRAEVLP
jgi:pimeloyl-ACP methyl ester carboxylesterase